MRHAAPSAEGNRAHYYGEATMRQIAEIGVNESRKPSCMRSTCRLRDALAMMPVPNAG
jgi:hypothetical protein